MKEIAVIGSAGIPGHYGGFETLAHNLVYRLHNQFSFRVYCDRKLYTKKPQLHLNNVNLCYPVFRANGWQSVCYDLVSMLNAGRRSDTFLILGISGGIFIGLIKSLFKKRIIVHIDGLEWKRKKWGPAARMLLKVSEKSVIRYADVIVADNKSISDYLMERYNYRPELLTYGGDHVRPEENVPAGYNLNKKEYYCTVSRIEPENNIHLILSAFRNLPGKKIVIIGNWMNNKYSRKVFREYSGVNNILLLHPVYDQSLLDSIRSNSCCYIHGHSAGGTNPALVEAMYLGLPVLTFDVIYNRNTTRNSALYFDSKEKLTNLLMNTRHTELQRIGSQLSKIARVEYTWDKITGQYASIF